MAGRLTTSDRRRINWEAHLRTLPLTTLKPATRLGATWMDDFVSTGRNVNLCGDCARRYGDWWRKVNYYPSQACVSDCDGCGTPLVSAMKFQKRRDERTIQ